MRLYDCTTFYKASGRLQEQREPEAWIHERDWQVSEGRGGGNWIKGEEISPKAYMTSAWTLTIV